MSYILDAYFQIIDFTKTKRFPEGVQQIAEAIVTDLGCPGYSHLTLAAIEGDPALVLSVGGLLSKLNHIKKLVLSDQNFQPRPIDRSDLGEWLRRIKKGIPEGRENLCFLEIQNVGRSEAEPSPTVSFPQKGGYPTTSFSEQISLVKEDVYNLGTTLPPNRAFVITGNEITLVSYRAVVLGELKPEHTVVWSGPRDHKIGVSEAGSLFDREYQKAVEKRPDMKARIREAQKNLL